MPKTICTKCSKIATKGNRCDKHYVAHGWSHTKNRHQRGYGNDWDKLRAKILKRDNHLCQTCLLNGIYKEAKQVDHIVNKAQGGTNDPSNLQSICISCHKNKTQEESKQGRACKPT